MYRPFGVTSMLLGSLPLVALGAGLAVLGWAVRGTDSLADAILPAALWTPVATVVAVVVTQHRRWSGGAVVAPVRGLPPRAQPGRLAGGSP
jgi:hypothetical protein